MEKYKTGLLDFGPIKTFEMKTLEKINLILKKELSYKEIYILIFVAAKTSEQPLVCSFVEICDMCQMSTTTFSSCLKTLRDNGLSTRKLNDFQYEFSIEL